MVILRIYGALAIFPLFCDHQDTESEAWGIEIGVDEPIFTRGNTKISMGQRYPCHTIWGKIVAINHIHGARAIFN